MNAICANNLLSAKFALRHIRTGNCILDPTLAQRDKDNKAITNAHVAVNLSNKCVFKSENYSG